MGRRDHFLAYQPMHSGTNMWHRESAIAGAHGHLFISRRFSSTEKASLNPRLTVRCAYPDTSLPPTEVTFGLSALDELEEVSVGIASGEYR